MILYQIRGETIYEFKIIHETNTRWFVGDAFVVGGYIAKGSKKYFTDKKEAFTVLYNKLFPRLKRLQDKVANMMVTCDALQEDREDVLKSVRVIRKPAKIPCKERYSKKGLKERDRKFEVSEDEQELRRDYLGFFIRLTKEEMRARRARRVRRRIGEATREEMLMEEI
jgi:hypothetical protein